jgi:Ca2+-transporting ATPase
MRDGRRIATTKGAPETVARLCALDPAAHGALLVRVDAMAARGLRVLAVADADLPADARAPETPERISFRFLGLVGLADPIRTAVPAAVRTCRDAGIRVAMITGDYPATASDVARRVGLARPDAVLTGAELAALDDGALARRIEDADVFARILPEQKLRIVRAFQAGGEVVAMTGDGVNDAPALRAADIGIAMGGRGTDVAREAAQLVVLDDDFASIVGALRLGRRIWDNLKHAMAYVIAIHVPIAALSLIPVVLGWPLLLLPMHVITLELVIDPACSIVFEAEHSQPDIMRRRPRPPGESLFSRRLMAFGLLQGFGLLVAVLFVHHEAMARGLGEAAARSLAFTSLVLGNLALIWTNRSRSRSIFALARIPNAALGWVTALALGALVLALVLPSARRLYHFAPVTGANLVPALVAAVACVAWFELLKRTPIAR